MKPLTFHNGFMFLLHILHMLSWIVKDTTTFELEFCGHKQATAHTDTCTVSLHVIELWTHQKFESFTKKSAMPTFEFESANWFQKHPKSFEIISGCMEIGESMSPNCLRRLEIVYRVDHLHFFDPTHSFRRVIRTGTYFPLKLVFQHWHVDSVRNLSQCISEIWFFACSPI